MMNECKPLSTNPIVFSSYKCGSYSLRQAVVGLMCIFSSFQRLDFMGL